MTSYPQLYLIRSLAALWVLFVTVAAGGAVYTVQRLHAETVANQLALAATHARAFEDHLTATLASVAFTLAETGEVSDPDRERLRAALRHIPILRSLSRLDEEDRIATSSNPANLGVTVERSGLLPPPAENGQLRFGPPWEGRDFAGGRPATPEQPVAAKARAFVPVVWEPPIPVPGMIAPPPTAAALNPNWLITLFQNNIPLDAGTVDLLRYDGMLLLSTDPAERMGQIHPLPPGADLSQEEFGALEISRNGEETLTAFRASRRHPLVVVVHLRREAALAKWRAEAGALGWATGLALLALTLLVGIALSRMARSMRREAEAEERMRLAAKVFESAEEGITITDGEGNIVSVNPAFERITGYTQSGVLGKNPRILASGRHAPPFYQAMWRAIEESGGWSGEIVNRRKNGELITEWLHISRLPGDDGKARHYVGVFTDISARKAAELALIAAKEAAEAANRAKSAFLANMSHELRTPLNAILGQAQILSHAINLTEEQRRGLAAIRRGGDHLATMIGEVLDLTRIEAGGLALVPGPSDLNALFARLESLFRQRSREKGLNLAWRMAPVANLVEIDERRLFQMVSHLLDNAVKFTERGEVSLRVSVEAAHRGRQLEVEVTDTGIGIEPERIAGLFRPFQQNGAEALRNQGRGMGLAICHALAEGMGGSIAVESDPGRGSRFALTLPLRLLELPAALPPPALEEGKPPPEEYPLPSEQRRQLLAWARRGEISAIRRHLDDPERRADPNPRIVRIRDLSARMDIKGIRQLLEAEERDTETVP